jgi:ribose 5-phosphate isomerase B
MIIAIGSDHAGYRYKELLKRRLAELGHGVQDFGAHSTEPVDYPTFIRPVALAVSRGEVDRGIVLGGSGNGEAIVANRLPGVRCTLCWNAASARLARAHNDSNCLSIGERMVTEAEALEILDVWLTTPFDGGRHQQRIDLIDKLSTGG